MEDVSIINIIIICYYYLPVYCCYNLIWLITNIQLLQFLSMMMFF